MNVSHMANVHEPRKEDKGQRRSILLEESSDNPHEQGTVAQFRADITTHKHEKCHHYAQGGRCFTR